MASSRGLEVSPFCLLRLLYLRAFEFNLLLLGDHERLSDLVWCTDLNLNTGQCVTLMIRSIWTKYNDLPNSMPKSSGTDTRDFVSFFLFWLCSLPAIWFPVHQIRHLFTVKAFFVPVAGVTYFIWAIVKAHGIGPIVHQGSTKAGGALGWAMVSGIMSSIANFATLIGTVLYLCLTTFMLTYASLSYSQRSRLF